MHPLLQTHQTFLFDLDGTLVDSVLDILPALNTALIAHKLKPVAEAQVRDFIGQGSLSLVEQTLQFVGANLSLLEPVHARFLTAYKSNVAVHTKALPGALELLTQLHAAGKALAVVTNKPEQPAKDLLAVLGMSPFLSLVVGGDTTPHRKPHPEPVLHAMKVLGASKQASLFVGDSIYDLNAAKAAQLACIALSSGYNQGVDLGAHGATLVVDSLNQLL